MKVCSDTFFFFFVHLDSVVLGNEFHAIAVQSFSPAKKEEKRKNGRVRIKFENLTSTRVLEQLSVLEYCRSIL